MPDTSTEVAIATTTLSGSGTATFNSIPNTYTDLRLVISGFLGSFPYIYLNNSFAANYSFTQLRGTGSAAASNRYTNDVAFYFNQAAFSTTVPALVIVDIFSYAGSTNKTVLINSNNDQNGSGEVMRVVGLWRNTSAITRIDFESFSTSGGTATLYGIL